MFTAFRATPFFRYSTICSAMRTPTISCASSVDPPMCGVAITLLPANSGYPAGGGSSRNTSSEAEATLPESSALRSAFSSISSPRAQFTMRTPGFIWAKASSRQHAFGFGGQRNVQRDVVACGIQRRQIRQGDSQIAGDVSRSHTDRARCTCISNARARLTTSRPILPKPTMPSDLPRSSLPRNFFFSHLPPVVEGWPRECDAPSPA